MFVDRRVANCPQYWLGSGPEDARMRVPDTVRKCVAFLVRPTAAVGGFRLTPVATAFFVGVPYGDGTRLAAHLVTARHVVNKLAGVDLAIRINAVSGDGQTFVIRGSERWFFHPTEADLVDAAVYPLFNTSAPEWETEVIAPTGDLAPDMLNVPLPMFLDDAGIAASGIGPGDAVFIAGMFTRLDMTRVEPIIRTGNIAAIPRRPIPNVTIGENRVSAEMYLIEVRSVGGLSGSPIFVRETMGLRGHRGGEGPRAGEQVETLCAGPFYFLGMMHGHWNIQEREHDHYDPQAVQANNPEAIAYGLSLAVPAKKIREVLFHPELVEMRRQLEQRQWEAEGSTSTE